MAKPNRNVLAKNSSGEIAYVCGKCGHIVQKEATICEKCGARLGKIRCPFCSFTGSVEDFKYDTCPKCGRNTDAGRKRNRSGNNTDDGNPYFFIFNKFWLLFGFLILALIAITIIFLKYFEFF